jgi:hypothetical protein
MRSLLLAGLLLSLLSVASAQTAASGPDVDSDNDGLNDAVENALLEQFVPRFMVSDGDCSVRPAQFIRYVSYPEVKEDNGTIYGQAFPRAGQPDEVELHYYHLWRRDCGELSHSLDAEHVSVLIHRDQAAKRKALYWYAAAHEDTVCDASQIARAATVDAELHGPTVWISRGKHASFLNNAICTHGCGGDNCRKMEPLVMDRLINLGELSAPMNGAAWTDSPQWPLADKLRRSDFVDTRMTRVDRLPITDIAWANPDKRPMQAVILGGNDAIGGAATGLRATNTALDVADIKTSSALNSASDNTGSALGKTFRGVGKALRITAQKVGGALGAN